MFNRQTVKLGEICGLMTGGTPSRAHKEYFEGGTVKWLVSGDIHLNEIFDCDGRITEAGLQNSNARILPVNSVMIALNGQGKTRATVAMLRTEATCNQSLVSIYPKDDTKVLPEYIYWNLRGRYDELRKLTGDAGNERRGLNMIIIRNIDIPVPPSIEKQKEIVKRLGAAFEKIDKAIELTKHSLTNSKQLVEHAIWSEFSELTNPVLLKDVSTMIVAGGDVPHRDNRTDARSDDFNIPIYTNGEKNAGLYGYTSRARIHEPSVTISARGTIGYTVVRREPFFPAIRLISVTPDTTKIKLEYLYYALRNLSYWNTGSSIPQLTVPDMKNYILPLFPMDKQMATVRRLDTYSSLSERLSSLYAQKLEDLQALEQSFLKQAFSQVEVE